MSEKSRKKVLIDTDIAFGSKNADVDDVLALMLAIPSDSLDVAAITPVGGNVSVLKASNNLHKFLKRIGKSGIPHAWSNARPMDPACRVKPERWDNAPPERITRPDDAPTKDSVDLLIETVLCSDKPMTVIPIGPLTNIGLALAKRPEIAAGIEEIVMMGGSFRMPGMRGLAEFNIWADPHAAAIVFDSPVPVKMFGLDVTKKRPVYPGDITAWDLPAYPLVKELHDSYLDYMVFRAERFRESEPFAFFHDAFPIAYLLHPEFFRMVPCSIDVDLCGEYTYGVTAIDFQRVASGSPGTEPKHSIALDVDEPAMREFVLRSILDGWKHYR